MRYVVLGLLVLLGLRLIRTGARARSGAEALLGGALVLLGLGNTLTSMGVLGSDLSLAVMGMASSSGAMLLLAGFTYRTFRYREPLGLGLMLAAFALTAAGFVHQLQLTGEHGSDTPSLLLLLSRVAVYGWTALESLRHWGMYRKRLALGLADPVVTNRFLLYAIWTSTAMVVVVSILVASLVGGNAGMTGWRAAFSVLVPPAAFVGLLCVVLTFVPPDAYLRWVELRHARRTQADGGSE